MTTNFTIDCAGPHRPGGQPAGGGRRRSNLEALRSVGSRRHRSSSFGYVDFTHPLLTDNLAEKEAGTTDEQKRFAEEATDSDPGLLTQLSVGCLAVGRRQRDTPTIRNVSLRLP